MIENDAENRQKSLKKIENDAQNSPEIDQKLVKICIYVYKNSLKLVKIYIYVYIFWLFFVLKSFIFLDIYEYKFDIYGLFIVCWYNIHGWCMY